MKINTNLCLYPCKTKYPILLVHGTGTRDDKRLSRWGRIPGALEKAGGKVFYSNQDAWGTIPNNAEMIKKRIIAILSKTGSDKVNIIALSKGGLDSRYMIHKLGMEDKVASLTTISTPHYGSKTMDFWFRSISPFLKSAALFINAIYLRQGDKSPDFYNVCLQFTTKHSEEFNREIINSDKVYYQSYASAMKKPYSDMILFPSHLVVKFFDGECDGIVSVNSAKWGEFRGIISGKRLRGVSHSDLRDLRRVGPLGKIVINAYIDIVSELREKGF
ncbi:MAG: triacylglycerol lipase [Defluviitaleaceae bacterium]|nr:triacylglycerol lipase [Defluviitaleaceae bacterium]